MSFTFVNETMVRLHQAATSSASWRVRIALALKTMAYESVWLDLHAAGSKVPGSICRFKGSMQIQRFQVRIVFRRISPPSLTSAAKPSSIQALAACGVAELRGQ